MRFIRSFIYILLLSVGAAAAQDVVKWSASTQKNSDGTYTVRFTADIETGWHVYDMEEYELGPNPTRVEYISSEGLTLEGGIKEVTKPVRKYDELFGMEIGYYEKRAVLEQRVRLKSPTATLTGEISFMACDDKTCLPPDEYEFTVKITGDPAPVCRFSAGASPGTEAADGTAGFTAGIVDIDPEGEPTGPEPSVELSAEFIPGDNPLGGSIWLIILAAVKWALLALVTPCIFPMIPMTVSFFMKEGTSTAGSRFRAFMYGLFIVCIYTVPIAVIILITRVVGGEEVTTGIFNWISTHWVPNVIFFLVFMVFAASFFGAFELNLPSWLVTRSDSKSEKGGLTGVFFMALTLVLVSFSCTAPIVSSALAEATSGGNWLRPIIAILSYSVVFALPFTIFAVFPAWMEKLPRSGGWLNSVKVVLGFVEVALGLKFLSVADQTYHWGILDREVYLAIWIVVFTLTGFYLLGKIKFKHDSDVKYIGVGRLGLVIATFAFVVYLVPGMFGAPLKALSGYLPPIHTQDFIAGGGNGNINSPEGSAANAPLYSDALHLPHGLTGFFDLDEAQAYADRVGKPLFVDITGHGCVNCREMEARVWSDPRVLELLRDRFVIVALYVDDRISVPESQWIVNNKGKTLKTLGKINAYKSMQLYGSNAQPLYIIQGRGGRIIAGPRGYDLNIDGFAAFLREGIERY